MKIAQSKYHFVGVGGIGMCGLAELLFEMGASVTGSDLAENAQVERLRALGVTVYPEHAASNVGDADVVVYSSAIKPGHVELEQARKMKIPTIPRAEALAELMRLKRGIAVAGTHGKTTTTSLLASVFLFARQDPTVVVGGRLEVLGSTAVLGRGPWLIAEADESDGSFSKLSPEMVVITNIDNDHLDFYKTEENLRRAFKNFALQVPFYGLVLACGDDPVIREVFADFSKKVKFYGYGAHNDYRLERGEKGFRVFYQDKEVGQAKFSMPGAHNALNALAAIAIGLECDLPFDLAKQGVEEFTGVDRRAQFKGSVGGVEVYDDYGHHPTEVAAVLKGFKESFASRRLVVYFQPHRYSRTQLCWQGFLQCFGDCDRLLIGDVYPAGEAAIDGISGEKMAAEISHPDVRYVKKGEDLCRYLEAGDIFLTLGAGDGWKLGIEVLKAYGH